MKPICVPCERFMRPHKTGFYFLEGMPTCNGAPPGLAEPEAWQPYKLWVGDLYRCPDCGAQTIVGVPPYPIAEHYQPDFAEKVAMFGAKRLLVKDC
jgi:hypothetical protein